MRQLLPAMTGSDPLSPDQLADLYRWPGAAVGDDSSPAPRRIRLNMVSTLDGAGAGADGRSGSINTAADHRVFALLRAWADVIVVGSQTVRTEGYAAAQTDPQWAALRSGRPPHPTLAVVTSRGALPTSLLPAPDTNVDAGDVMMLTTKDADPDAVRESIALLGAEQVIQEGDSSVDLSAALDALSDRGCTRILCEGGPGLAGQLLSAGLVDELCLTWSPLLVGGDGTRILRTGQLASPARLLSLLEEEGTLIGRWELAG